MNGYFQISGSASVPVTTNGNTGQPGGPVSLVGTQPWTYGSVTFQWGFQFDAQTHVYVTDIIFQTKYINKSIGASPDPNTVYGTRSSMLYIPGVHTVPDHCPFISLRTPIHVPPSWQAEAICFNHNNNGEDQNMIGTLLGYCWDNPTDEGKFWTNDPKGWAI